MYNLKELNKRQQEILDERDVSLRKVWELDLPTNLKMCLYQEAQKYYQEPLEKLYEQIKVAEWFTILINERK